MIAEECFHMIAELSPICNRPRSYGNQPLTSIWKIVTLVIQFTIIDDLFHNLFSL